MSIPQQQTTNELFEQAKVDFKALDTLLKLVSEASDTFEKSKKSLKDRLSLVFKIAINKNKGLQILESKSIIATLDEPAEQSFVDDFIDELIQEAVDEKEKNGESFFLITEEAMQQLDVRLFEKLLSEVKKDLPIEVVVDTKKCKISISHA